MSRLRLQWFNLEPKAGNQLSLKIPICDVYRVIIDRAFPDLDHIGWRDAGKGTGYTYCKNIDDADQQQIEALLALLKQILCLTITDHLKPHFTNDLSEAYALDFNFKEDVSPKEYTKAGNAEHAAKNLQTPAAISALAKTLAKVIQIHPTLNGADIITAVPPRPSSTFHLPTKLVDALGTILNRQTGLGISKKEHTKLKTLSMADKITTLHGAFALIESVRGKTVLLVDDLYQSGTTVWSLAKFLRGKGAREVYALACVKSWRDTDNQ